MADARRPRAGWQSNSPRPLPTAPGLRPQPDAGAGRREESAPYPRPALRARNPLLMVEATLMEAPATASPNLPSLLLVDDERYFRRFVGSLMETRFGFKVVEAKDGDEAVALCPSVQPALVLLDINMPRRNGIDTLRALRAACPDLPIIMLTSISEESVVEECIEAGATHFVRKDLPADEIVQELTLALGDLLDSAGSTPPSSP